MIKMYLKRPLWYCAVVTYILLSSPSFVLIAQEVAFKPKFEYGDPRFQIVNKIKERGDSLKSIAQREKGDSLLMIAHPMLNDLENVARSEENWDLLFLSLEAQGDIERRIIDLDKSLETAQEAMDLIREGKVSSPFLQFRGYSLIGKIKQRLTDFYRAAELLDTAQLLYSKSKYYDSAGYRVMLDYRYYSYQYANLSLDTLVKYLPERIDIIRKMNSEKETFNEEVLYTLQDYVTIYNKSGNFDMALAYALSNYQYALKHEESIRRASTSTFESTFIFLCNALIQKEEYEKALSIGLNVYKRILQNKDSDRYFYANYYDVVKVLGEIYTGLGQPKEANKYYSELLSMKKDNITQFNFEIEETYAQLKIGLNLIRLEEVEDAESILLQSLKNVKRLIESPNSELILNYQAVANAYSQLGNWGQSLHYYDSALRNTELNYKAPLNEFPQFDSTNRFSLVSLELLKDKSEAYYKSSPEIDTNKFSIITEYVDQTHYQLDKNRQELYRTEGKLFISENFKRLYDIGISACFEVYRITGDDKYAKKAHEYMRLSKSNLLQEQSKDFKEFTASGIPYFLKERFYLKQQSVDSLKSQLLDFIEVSVTSDSVLILNEQILQSEEELNQLKDSINMAYPNTINYNMESIVEDLSNTQVLLEYFYGEESIYVVSASPQKGYSLFKIPLNGTIEEQIDKLISWNHEPPDVENISNTFEEYKETSFGLYKLLVEPGLNMSGDSRQLIIVPDEKLTRLSFESLAKSNQGKNFKELNYLIKENPIQYLFTSNKTSFISNSLSVNNKILGIGYSGEINLGSNSSNLGALPGTEEEIQFLQANFQGDYYLGEQGTKKTFLQRAGQYGVLHLAVHGVANTDNRFQSSLIFNGEDNLLFPSQLYLANINSRLAVLSACESGVGTIQKGEGTFSIARGFAIVGVPNIIMSLWSVNDKITSQQMLNFYNLYFNENQSINKSLRDLKMDFIEDADSYLAHPYYWASFVHLGADLEEKEAHINLSWLEYCLIVLLMIGLVLSYNGYKKRKGT